MEDRGSIGVGGRRLYRVHVFVDPFEPMSFELSEDEIEAPDGETVEPPMEKDKVIAYLKCGGLLSILRSNLPGGKNLPGVWLRPDNLGNVTHTFVPARGGLGGLPIPYGAIRGVKIVSAKRGQVLSLLESFGLSPAEAEEVVAEVGTTP